MSSEETKFPDKPFDFSGAWLPGIEPLLIGGKNFTSMANQVPDPSGLCGCLGYTKVTSSALSTYLRARSGIQLRTKDSMLSGLFVQALNVAGTASVIMQQLATTSGDDVPNVKNFESTPVHIDAAGAGLGRFSRWPRNQIAYCNGVETRIYGGPEMTPAKVMLCSGSMSDTLTNPVDYSDALTNNLKTAGNTMRLGALPSTLVLYLKGNGSDGSTTITDSSPSGHTVTAGGNAQIDTAYKKHGNGSIKYDGTGDVLSAPYSSDWNFSTNNFTISLEKMFDIYAGTGSRGICGQYLDADNYWLFGYDDSSILWLPPSVKLFFKVVVSGVTIADYITTTATTLTYGSFHHAELVRSGTNIFMFINGVKKTLTENTAIGSTAMPDFNTALRIGDGLGLFYTEQGWHDEVMIFNGSALHITNFTPPTTEYTTTANNFITICTSRPIQAIKPYINDVNVESGAAVSGRVWDGANFFDLAITDGSSGLTVDQGIISFDSTVGLAKPRIINGCFYYVYQFALDAGSAEIYRITVDEPWQPPVNLWDGVLRPCIKCKNSIGGTIQDQTEDVADETPTGVADDTYYTMGLDNMTTDQWVNLTFAEKTCAVKIKMYDRITGNLNTNTATVIVYYWNGAEYIQATGVIDGTSVSGKTFAQTGYISWNPTAPGHEFPKTENDETLWNYRLMVSAQLSGNPTIDKIEGIPAPQLTNQAYKFPMMLQNRAMLCGLMSTGEGNRIDYATTHSTEGWNGSDSSFGDGRGPIYIGDQNDLTAGCEIFNRLGQSIYTFGLLFKANQTHILHGYDAETFQSYQLNDKIGCPAPETLDTQTIFSSKEAQSSRSIAAWLSYVGPYMFDAAGLTYLPGLECYFDKNDSRCINYAAIDAARGWWDADLPQYNLQIPSGAGQTTNNVWVVYDHQKQKWYPKVPNCTSPFLSAVVRVKDATEKSYIYGFRENGYAMRLEYGTTWDGTAIAQHIETGEILAADDMWRMLKNKILKLIYVPTTEASVNLTITMYIDGDTTGNSIATISLTKPATGADSTKRILKINKNVTPKDFWCYRLRFSASTSASAKGMQLLAWAMKFSDERAEDTRT